MSSRTVLSLDTVCDIDKQAVKTAFDRELKKMLDDCYERPQDKTARKVRLELLIVPKANDDGTAERVATEFHVTSKMPGRKSQMYDMQLKPNGRALFNPESLGDASQRTLDDTDE